MRSKIVVGLVIGGLAATVGASRSAASEGAEYPDWKAVLAQTAANPPVPETIKILDQFVRAHPKGEHAPDARFAAAEALYADGQYAEALPRYQSLVDSRDETYYGDALLRMGEAYYDTKRYASARASWQKVIDKVSGKSLLAAEALYGLTLCDLSDKNFLAADKTLDRLVHKFPAYANQSKTKELLGIIRFQEKNYADANANLEGLATPSGALYRGLSFFYRKQYLEAANSFNELSLMEAGAYAEIGFYFKAECFRMAQNVPLAIQAYDEFLQNYPKSRLTAYAMIQKANLLIKVGRNDEADASLKWLKTLTTSNDIRAYALYLESQIASKSGNNKEALRLIDQAIDILPPAMSDLYLNVQLTKASYLVHDRRWSEAAGLMQKALQKTPYSPVGIVASMLTGQDAYLRKDWNAAASNYESALLRYTYNGLSDVAMAMLLSTSFDAQRYQEVITNSNRVVQVVDTQFAVQNKLWRAYSHFLIGESYYRLHLYAEASRSYEEAMKHPSLSDQARLYMAWSRYHEAKYADAIDLAQQVYAQSAAPEEYRASAYFLMGGSYFNQKNYAAAIQSFQGFRTTFPRDSHVPESLLQEGWAQRQSGYAGDAVVVWEKLATTFPKDPLAEDAMLQIGQLYFAGRQYGKAARAFSALLASWPGSKLAVEAQWSLAQSDYNAGEFDKAIKEYGVFIAKFPQDSRIADAQNQVMLATYRNASRSEDPVLLADFVRAYPKSTQAPEAQYQLSRIYFDRKVWHSATEQFQKLLLDYPGANQAPSALFAIAQAQEYLKKPDDAVNEYESLLKLFPTNPLALDAAMRLGAIYYNQQQYRQAAKSFGFVADRDAPPAVKADAIYNAAICFKKDGAYDEALRNLATFSDSFPADKRQTDVLLQTASIRVATGQPLKAVDTYHKLLERKDLSDSQKIEIYAQVGDLYKGAGDKANALDAYAALMTLSPLNADARLLGLVQLAALYEEREKWDKALEVYDQIRTSHGKPDWVRAAAKRRKEIKAYLTAQKASPQVAANPADNASAQPAAAADAGHPPAASPSGAVRVQPESTR